MTSLCCDPVDTYGDTLAILLAQYSLSADSNYLERIACALRAWPNDVLTSCIHAWLRDCTMNDLPVSDRSATLRRIVDLIDDANDRSYLLWDCFDPTPTKYGAQTLVYCAEESIKLHDDECLVAEGDGITPLHQAVTLRYRGSTDGTSMFDCMPDSPGFLPDEIVKTIALIVSQAAKEGIVLYMPEYCSAIECAYSHEAAFMRDKNGWTPFHAAMRYGNIMAAEYIVRRLSADGYDTNSIVHGRDNEGYTPLDHFEQFLCRAGATIGTRVDFESCPVYSCAFFTPKVYLPGDVNTGMRYLVDSCFSNVKIILSAIKDKAERRAFERRQYHELQSAMLDMYRVPMSLPSLPPSVLWPAPESPSTSVHSPSSVLLPPFEFLSTSSVSLPPLAVPAEDPSMWVSDSSMETSSDDVS